MTRVKVNEGSLAQLRKIVEEKYAVPRLQSIRKDVRKDIADLATPFRGVSSTSIADTQATTGILNKPKLMLSIKPVPFKTEVFLRNLEGRDRNFGIIFEQMSANLQEWTIQKYTGRNREGVLDGFIPLKLRSKFDTGGRVPPLGAPERDVFGRAFDRLIDNVGKYDLIRTR